ncbi:MAG: hypothetical protein RI902_1465 [Pseudomonadota bacterium]|jgi:L-fuconolactonase
MIDAHFHCWQLDRNDYGWLTPQLSPIYRDVTLADWMVHAKAHGITGGVLVQAAPTLAETEFLLHQAQQHAMVLGVVGWVDMLAEDAIMQIERLSQSSKLKGLRPMLQDLPDPDWILQPQIQPILQYMAAHDLVFDALIKPHHLPNILKLVHQHPQLRVVIDHGAKPRIEAKQRSEWQLQMKQLAHQSDPQRVACKLSGLWTEAKPGSECEVVRPWCEDLIAIWGDTRLMWGSDWPVLELAGSYATWRNLTLDILKSHTPESQRKILALNALRMYGL